MMLAMPASPTTTDLGFAAALVTLGHVMEDRLRFNGSQALFAFHMAEEDMRALYSAYRTMGMQVDAYKNAQALKNLKRLLREQATAE